MGGEIREEEIFSMVSAVLKSLILTDRSDILTGLRSLCTVGSLGLGLMGSACRGHPGN